MTSYILKISPNKALIHWNGNKGDVSSEVMYILTRNKRGSDIIASELWISRDYGQSWSEIDTDIRLEDDTVPNVLLHFVMSPLDVKLSIFTGPVLFFCDDFSS